MRKSHHLMLKHKGWYDFGGLIKSHCATKQLQAQRRRASDCQLHRENRERERIGDACERRSDMVDNKLKL